MVNNYHPATPAASGEENMQNIVDIVTDIIGKAAPDSVLYEVDGMVCRLTVEVLGKLVSTNNHSRNIGITVGDLRKLFSGRAYRAVRRKSLEIGIDNNDDAWPLFDVAANDTVKIGSKWIVGWSETIDCGQSTTQEIMQKLKDISSSRLVTG